MTKPEEFGRLLDWVEGRLGARETADVAAAVAGGDERNATALAWIRQFSALRADTAFAHPPPGLHQRLVDVFDARHPAESRRRLRERIAAALTFDSGFGLALAPARSVELEEPVASERHLVYSCAAADIALDLHQVEEDRIRVHGHVLPLREQVEFTSVQLDSGSGPTLDVAVDEHGMFSFDDVAPRSYQLAVLGSVEVVVLLRLEGGRG
jgi:hypothetical protein